MKVKSLSRVRLLVTPWTAAYQAPPSMGFSRQEYRSGVPLSPPEAKNSGVFHISTTAFQCRETGRTYYPEKTSARFLLSLINTLIAAKSVQSCPTLCDPIDVSPPGSLAPGILQARTLEWVAK